MAQGVIQMLGNFLLNLFNGTGSTSQAPAQPATPSPQQPSANSGGTPAAEPTPADSPAAVLDFSGIVAGASHAAGSLLEAAGTAVGGLAGAIAEPAADSALAAPHAGAAFAAETSEEGVAHLGIVVSNDRPEDLARAYALMAQRALVAASLADRLAAPAVSAPIGLENGTGEAFDGPKAA